MADCVAKRRHAHGERAGNSKLTEADVRSIRQSKQPLSAVAKRFEISTGYASEIRSGRRWAYVE
jgi:hypothetical protein